MRGYFISEEKVKELGLLHNLEISKNLQKTVIVIKTNDLQNENPNIELDTKQLSNFAKWFYENYYQSLMESFFIDYERANK